MTQELPIPDLPPGEANPDRLSKVGRPAGAFLDATREETWDGRPPLPAVPPVAIQEEDEQDEFTEYDAYRLRKLAIARANRDIEALRLYRTFPTLEEFHKARCPERVIRAANRTGKTTSALVEVARAVTNQDPWQKYPKTGVAYIVGKDGNEVSQVLWKKLYSPGAFRIIRDKKTGEWRPFVPDSEDDVGREAESRPAPPLLAHRFVADIAWESQKEDLPKVVTLTTGWKIHFYSSNSLPTHGTSIDLALFDEEIQKSQWYYEVAARLVDRRGMFIWSATPQAGTEQLYNLHLRAEEEFGSANPSIREFIPRFDENYFVSKAAKAEFIKKLPADELAVRVGGEFAIQSWRVYPEFSVYLHGVDAFPIPANWTKYVAIDPGHQTTAGLFLAVPPDDDPVHGGYRYLYDELYIKNCHARKFAEGMKKKAEGKAQVFEDFIIDGQEAKKHDTGSGKEIGEQYSEALAELGVVCNRNGSGFTIGAATPKAGVMACRKWLHPDSNTGKPPILRVFTECVPSFLDEIKHYRYKRCPGGDISDDPESRGAVHLMACWRYLAQYDPKWVEPRSAPLRINRMMAFADALLGKSEKNQYSLLGPES